MLAELRRCLMSREYESSHPWLNFKFDLRLNDRVWRLMGEAESKIEHVAAVPLLPAAVAHLNHIYLSRGVYATTHIEGNTLSEEQVMQAVDGTLKLPKSQEYLKQEVDNILEACNLVLDDVAEGRDLTLTPDRIKEFNRLVLKGLTNEGETAGEVRRHSVLVGNVYRGAPAADCEYLLDRLCTQLQRVVTDAPPDMTIPASLLCSIAAHLYIAWIHPFANGNGRVARLVELQLLLQAKVPSVAAHLLSDHYNKTRSKYYEMLARASHRSQANYGYPIDDFVKYAMEGFVDGLREQIGVVQAQQLHVTWEHYVHTMFHGRGTPACQRQKELVLELGRRESALREEVPTLTPRLAVMYAGKSAKTVSRDINALEKLFLIHIEGKSIAAATDLLLGFMSLRAGGEE